MVRVGWPRASGLRLLPVLKLRNVPLQLIALSLSLAQLGIKLRHQPLMFLDGVLQEFSLGAPLRNLPRQRIELLLRLGNLRDGFAAGVRLALLGHGVLGPHLQSAGPLAQLPDHLLNALDLLGRAAADEQTGLLVELDLRRRAG